jgi:hypothetical protein
VITCNQFLPYSLEICLLNELRLEMPCFYYFFNHFFDRVSFAFLKLFNLPRRCTCARADVSDLLLSTDDMSVLRAAQAAAATPHWRLGRKGFRNENDVIGGQRVR